VVEKHKVEVEIQEEVEVVASSEFWEEMEEVEALWGVVQLES
jgi:hypothetical protein